MTKRKPVTEGDTPMSDATTSRSLSEDELAVLEAAHIPATDEVADFLASFVPVEQMPVSTRGVTDAHRALAALLLSTPDIPRRTPDVEAMRKAAPVIGRLLVEAGFRLKQREAMYPVRIEEQEDGTKKEVLGSFIVMQAVRRPTKEEIEQRKAENERRKAEKAERLAQAASD